MDNRSFEYCAQQIGFTGFALVSPYWASKLRPDIFSSPFMAVSLTGSIDDVQTKFECEAYTVTFQDGDQVRCLAKTKDALIERIKWITGAKVNKVELYVNSSQPQANQAEVKAKREREANIKRLQAVAAQDLPSHDCSERREILDAKKALESLL